MEAREGKTTIITIDNAKNGVKEIELCGLKGYRCVGHGFHLVVGVFICPDKKKSAASLTTTSTNNNNHDNDSNSDFEDVDLEGVQQAEVAEETRILVKDLC